MTQVSKELQELYLHRFNENGAYNISRKEMLNEIKQSLEGAKTFDNEYFYVDGFFTTVTGISHYQG